MTVFICLGGLLIESGLGQTADRLQTSDAITISRLQKLILSEDHDAAVRADALRRFQEKEPTIDLGNRWQFYGTILESCQSRPLLEEAVRGLMRATKERDGSYDQARDVLRRLESDDQSLLRRTVAHSALTDWPSYVDSKPAAPQSLTPASVSRSISLEYARVAAPAASVQLIASAQQHSEPIAKSGALEMTSVDPGRSLSAIQPAVRIADKPVLQATNPIAEVSLEVKSDGAGITSDQAAVLLGSGQTTPKDSNVAGNASAMDQIVLNGPNTPAVRSTTADPMEQIELSSSTTAPVAVPVPVPADPQFSRPVASLPTFQISTSPSAPAEMSSREPVSLESMARDAIASIDAHILSVGINETSASNSGKATFGDPISTIQTRTHGAGAPLADVPVVTMSTADAADLSPSLPPSIGIESRRAGSPTRLPGDARSIDVSVEPVAGITSPDRSAFDLSAAPLLGLSEALGQPFTVVDVAAQAKTLLSIASFELNTDVAAAPKALGTSLVPLFSAGDGASLSAQLNLGSAVVIQSEGIRANLTTGTSELSVRNTINREREAALDALLFQAKSSQVNALVAEGKYEDARAQCLQTIIRSAGSEQQRMTLRLLLDVCAREMAGRGGRNAAIALFEQQITKTPSADEYATLYIGLHLYQEQEHEAAITRLDQFLSKYPKTQWLSEAKLAQALSWIRLNNNDKALTLLQTAVAECPTAEQTPRARFLIGWIHLSSYRKEEARLAFKSVLDHHPNTEFATKAKQLIEYMAGQ